MDLKVLFFKKKCLMSEMQGTRLLQQMLVCLAGFQRHLIKVKLDEISIDDNV